MVGVCRLGTSDVHLKKYLQYIIVLMRVKMNTGRNQLAVYACDVPINLSVIRHRQKQH